MFGEDNRCERFLDRLGAKWDWVNDIPVSMMVDSWQKMNISRRQNQNEDAVQEYYLRFRKKEVAPAPILWATKNGYQVLDGTLRLLALTKMYPLLIINAAYVVKTNSPQLARRIQCFANSNLSGKKEPETWVIRNAIRHCPDMPTEEIAEQGGWAIARVRREAVYLEWKEKLQGIGAPDLNIDLTHMIAKNAQEVDLQKAPGEIASFCSMLVDGNFDNGESEPLVELFFDVPRGNPKGINAALRKSKEEILDLEDVQVRLKGRKVNKRRDDTNLMAQLRSARTAALKVAKKRENIPYIEEAFKIHADIERHLSTIKKHSQRRRAKKN
jgi:hypothetical protein